MALSARKLARSWGENSAVLAQWVMQNVATATDSAMNYPSRKEAGQGALPEAVEETVDSVALQRHFATKDPQDLMGIPTCAGNGDTKLLVVEIESDPATALPTPGVLFQAALHWQERLELAGFDVGLEACTPAGGFRLWMTFDFPVEATRAADFGLKLISNHAEQGLNHAPRIYPNATDGQYLRLPGMHPFTEAWSHFWVVPEGTQEGHWTEGAEAAQTFMSIKPVSGNLMREHLPPVVAESMGIEQPLTENGRQWISASESEHARSLLAAIDTLTASSDKTSAENSDAEQAIDEQDIAEQAPVASSPPPLPIDTHHAIENPIEAIATRTGLRDEVIVQRIQTWFSAQDEDTQDIILGITPKAMQPDVARLALERMASQHAA